MIIGSSLRGRRRPGPRQGPRQELYRRRVSAGAAWTGWRRPPAACRPTGRGRSPATGRGRSTRRSSTSGRERRLTPLITVTDCMARSAYPLLSSQSRVSASSAGRVHVGRHDHHQLVGDLEQPGEAGRARVKQGQRVVPVQLDGKLDLVAVPERFVRGDDIEPRRIRLRRRVQAVRPGRPDVLRRLACQELLKPGGRGTVAGQRAVVEVHRRYRVLAQASHHGRGHERGNRLAGTARAAEDKDPARIGDGQPRPVPVLRFLVAGAGTMRGAVAGDDLDLAAPGGVQVARRAA